MCGLHATALWVRSHFLILLNGLQLPLSLWPAGNEIPMVRASLYVACRILAPSRRDLWGGVADLQPVLLLSQPQWGWTSGICCASTVVNSTDPGLGQRDRLGHGPLCSAALQVPRLGPGQGPRFPLAPGKRPSLRPMAFSALPSPGPGHPQRLACLREVSANKFSS